MTGGWGDQSDVLAARHFDPLRGDPAVIAAEQARDGRADVVGHADAAERDHVGEGIVVFGRVAHRLTEEVGLDRTRRDDVCGDAAGYRADNPSPVLASFLQNIDQLIAYRSAVIGRNFPP